MAKSFKENWYFHRLVLQSWRLFIAISYSIVKYMRFAYGSIIYKFKFLNYSGVLDDSQFVFCLKVMF